MPDEREDESRFFEGCLFGLAALILGVGVMVVLARAGSAIVTHALSSAVAAFGLTQLILIVPLLIILFRARRQKAALGVITFAALVFLLSAACYGIVTSIGR